MPINQYPSSEIPQSPWWIHPQVQQPTFMDPTPNKFSDHHHPPTAQNTTAFNFNLNQDDDDELDATAPDHDERESESGGSRSQLISLDVLKEAMFEKPLTPSDVGKLNRLVIPKQHAERHFPLSGLGDSAGGLLLSFEDESGKCWRFRYSYWNSSQSYVLTKGWSRFVKEKRLDAGDVVLFQRHRVDADRLFIGWRRRGDAAAAAVGRLPLNVGVGGNSSSSGGGGGGSGWGRVYYSSAAAAHAYPVQPYPPHGNVPCCLPYQPHCLHAGAGGQNQTSTPSGNSKTLRLFGVDLECQQQQQQPQPDESEPSTPDGSSTSSQGGQPYYYHYSTNLPHPSIHQTDMAQDINFSRGTHQMRYHQG